MKNRVLLKAVRFLQRKIAPSTGQRKILAVSSTALGDTLWTLPALESLRKSFPDAYIALLTSPIGEQATRHNPWIDKTYILKEPMLPRFWKLWRQLKREQFQEILIFHTSQRLMLPLCALLGAEKIVGTEASYKGLGSLLTDAVPPAEEHEIERRLRLIERIGAAKHSETLSFFLQPQERLSTTEPTIALHPGSKDGFKRWPIKHFAAVGKELSGLGFRILITGNRSEQEVMRETADKIPGAELLDPSLSLRQFAARLEQINLLISNDTGPVHLACALQTPVLALYCPTDPIRCGPHRAQNAAIIARQPACEPCLKRNCLRPFCLLQIGPQEVIDAAKNMLGKNSSSRSK